MTVEIISQSISTKIWDRTLLELATPGSAVRHASVARYVTDCARRPVHIELMYSMTSHICVFVFDNVPFVGHFV